MPLINTPTTAMERRERPTERVQNLLLTLPFLALFLAQLIHHAMWRDELNAFGISAASANLRQLLGYVHFEGHPWLWYVLLWLVSRVTTNAVVGMKVLEAAIGTGIYLVLGLQSPFSRWQKVLLFLCYFISFEYTVLTRMYGVMLLLALLYLRRRARYPARVAGNAVLLGLLASTDMTGIILSVGLLAEFVFSPSARALWSSADRRERRRLVSGAAIFAVLFCGSVLSVVPNREVSTRTTGRMFEKARDRGHITEAVLDYTVMPYFPTVTMERRTFWGANAGAHWKLFELCVPLVLLAYWAVLRRRKRLLLLVGGTLFMAAAFGDLIYLGATRHFGITVVALLAALWLLRQEGQPIAWPAYVLLGLLAVAGVEVAVRAWSPPFSNTERTAHWIASSPYRALPLVGTPDVTVAAIAEVLHRPVYMLDCSCQDTFLLFSKRRDHFTLADIPARLLTAQQALGQTDLLYVDNKPLAGEKGSAVAAEGFSVRPVAQFTGAELREEDFYVYVLHYAVARGPQVASAAATGI